MKKYTFYTMTILLFLSIMPSQLRAKTNVNAISYSTKKTIVSAEATAEANAIITRLNEIKALDKSNLTANEKQQLRREVRTLNTKVKKLNGGVYFSAGALVVILLLVLLIV